MTNLICCRCGVHLEERKVTFSYMGNNFFVDQPCYPKCGQVYLTEELVRGKMAEVELQREDK